MTTLRAKLETFDYPDPPTWSLSLGPKVRNATQILEDPNIHISLPPFSALSRCIHTALCWHSNTLSQGTIDMAEPDMPEPVIAATELRPSGPAVFPVLWSASSQTPLSNQIREILMLIDNLNQSNPDKSLFPSPMRTEANMLLHFITAKVLRQIPLVVSGGAHSHAGATVVEALERLEDRLTWSRFLMGKHVTAPDFFLFAAIHPLLDTRWKSGLESIINKNSALSNLRDYFTADANVRQYLAQEIALAKLEDQPVA